MTEIAGKWLRVSTGAQDEANQDPDLDRWIETHNYTPGPVYRLRGKSASKGKHQAELDAVIEDMRAGKLSVLVVWKLDRIERRGAWSVFDLVRKVREAGGRIEFVLDPHLNETNDLSDTMLAFSADQARLESKRTSQRVRATHERIKGNGGVIGRAGYGYRIEGDRHNKRLVVFEPEARVIREAADRYLDGETIDALCADFNARGIASPMWKGQPGKHWHAKTLAGLLRSASVAGRRVDAAGKTVHTFEPIVTWDEHLRLVARLDSRAHRKGISPGNVALLTGMLFDAEDNPMYRINAWAGKQYYARKSKVGVALDEMDAFVSGLFERNPDPYLIPQLVPGDNHADEIARLRQDRAELDDLAADYEEQHARLTARIRELAREDAEHPNPDRIEMIDTGQTLGDRWQAMSTADRRDMLLERGAKVRYLGPGDFGYEDRFAGLRRVTD